MPLHTFPLRASIAVSDIRRAVECYEGTLGLEAVESGPSADIADPDGNTFAVEADI